MGVVEVAKSSFFVNVRGNHEVAEAITEEQTQTRTNTHLNDTKANAAGRRGVCVRSANDTYENQGAWGA